MTQTVPALDTSKTSQEVSTSSSQPTLPKVKGVWRIFVFSAIGLLFFFLPVTLHGHTSIPVDHLVGMLKATMPQLVRFGILALIIFGAIRSIVTKQWQQGKVQAFFALANVLGALVSIAFVAGMLPEFLMHDTLAPFLWERVATQVGMIVLLSAAFLALLLNYGLLEFVGVLLQPIMRPLFKTPGRSAVDAVASFVGNFSLGLLITDRVYRNGGYSTKEAAIIAVGFSTASTPFYVIVANALNLMHIWGQFFLASIIVTFVVTAITVRFPPLSAFPDTYFEGMEPAIQEESSGSRWFHARREALIALQRAPKFLPGIVTYVKDAFFMVANILPAIMSLGLGTLALARYTPIFEWIGYVFYPFAWIMQLPNPELVGKAASISLADMLLPVTVAAGHESEPLRFVVGMICLSAIVCFNGVIPCIVGTKIPLSIFKLLVIWLQRVILTILLAAPIAYLIL